MCVAYANGDGERCSKCHKEFAAGEAFVFVSFVSVGGTNYYNERVCADRKACCERSALVEYQSDEDCKFFDSVEPLGLDKSLL